MILLFALQARHPGVWRSVGWKCKSQQSTISTDPDIMSELQFSIEDSSEDMVAHPTKMFFKKHVEEPNC